MKSDKPSATASLILKIVLFTAYDTKRPNILPSGVQELSESMALRVISFPRLFLLSIKNTFFRWFLRKVEHLFNPGFILHVAARKAYIDRLVTDLLRSGYDQVIIIGAGYDTLGLRTSMTHKNVACFEIDHPQTQKVKKLSVKPEMVASNLFFISANLAVQSISDTLKGHPQFDFKKKTIVVIEGVLMYLETKAVEKLFRELFNLFSGGLACIFTFMNRQASGSMQFQTAHPLVKWWLEQKQERFLWGYPCDELSLYLKGLGFSEGRVFGERDLAAALFGETHPLPKLAVGEMICQIIRS